MKARVLLSVLLASYGVLFLAAPAYAHHSFAAEFDGNKPITLRGTLSRMLWSNPHGWMYLDVKGPDGKVVTWAIETNGPNALYRRGWKQTDLPVGIELVIEGFLSKDGTAKANATNVMLPDGRKLFAGSTGPDSAPAR